MRRYTCCLTLRSMWRGGSGTDPVTSFAMPFHSYHKMIILPRQARDKHRESAQNMRERCVFFASTGKRSTTTMVSTTTRRTWLGTANCTIIDHFLHLNRDWSPRFSTLRDENGWVRAKTVRNLNLGVSRNRFCDFLADPDSRSFSRFGAIIMQFAVWTTQHDDLPRQARDRHEEGQTEKRRSFCIDAGFTRSRWRG
jgi:hypothetical protein